MTAEGSNVSWGRLDKAHGARCANRGWEHDVSLQDETGAAAIFATELDDKLGGKAKQYRQVQEGESPEFLQVGSPL